MESKPLVKSGSFWGYVLMAVPYLDMGYQYLERSSAVLPFPVALAVGALGGVLGVYKTYKRTTTIEGVFK